LIKSHQACTDYKIIISSVQNVNKFELTSDNDGCWCNSAYIWATIQHAMEYKYK